jgi:predicted transcriptional regulator
VPPPTTPPDPLPGAELESLTNARRILREIETAPGVHHREIQRRLALPTGVVEYHLHRLVKQGLVVERKEGGYTRYFPERGLTEEERRALSFLRQETPRLIVLYLLEAPGSRHGDILKVLAISGATLTHHLKRMLAAKLLLEEKEGGTVRYRLAHPEEAKKVLIAYRPSFLDRIVDQVVASWQR